MIIHDRLQRRDKNHLSRISAINPDQIRLILQSSTGLGIETRVTIYLTTRNSQLQQREETKRSSIRYNR